MGLQRAVVRALYCACGIVDEVAYRPAVVRLTLRLPRVLSEGGSAGVDAPKGTAARRPVQPLDGGGG